MLDFLLIFYPSFEVDVHILDIPAFEALGVDRFERAQVNLDDSSLALFAFRVSRQHQRVIAEEEAAFPRIAGVDRRTTARKYLRVVTLMSALRLCHLQK